MNAAEVKGVLDQFNSDGDLNLVMIMRSGRDPRPLLELIRSSGYAAYVRQTSNGVELIVTDKIHR